MPLSVKPKTKTLPLTLHLSDGLLSTCFLAVATEHYYFGTKGCLAFTIAEIWSLLVRDFTAACVLTVCSNVQLHAGLSHELSLSP